MFCNKLSQSQLLDEIWLLIIWSNNELLFLSGLKTPTSKFYLEFLQKYQLTFECKNVRKIQVKRSQNLVFSSHKNQIWYSQLLHRCMMPLMSKVAHLFRMWCVVRNEKINADFLQTSALQKMWSKTILSN